MKPPNKTVLALVTMAAMLLATLFLPKHFATALTSPPTVSVGNFKFLDAATITGNIDGNTITFTDGNPTDSTRNYRPQGLDSSTFCDYKTSGNQRYGINITSSDLSGASISATIGLGYVLQSGNNSSCPQIPAANIQPSSNITIANPGSAATSFYRWEGANIVNVDSGQTFQPKPAANTTPYINESNIGSCEASGIILLSGTSGGTLYRLGSIGGGSSLPSNISSFLNSPNSCSLVSKNTINIAGTAPSSANTGGIVNCDPKTNSNCVCSSQGCTLTSTTNQSVPTDDSSACVANSHTSLEWILCPITTSISKFVDTMIKVIEDQLNFDVGSYLPDSGQVHTVWAIFKNLVSAMIIIVLLIMVISQAVGTGPFDAYTIRKILPKLIIAIIFMQLSWYMAKYLITLANDFGHGIRQIMLAPFNGAGNMDLNSILNHLNGSWALGVNVVGFSGMLIAVLAFSEFILPILALVAFSVAMSVLVALATLLFRNVLIILLVILFPAALLLWALPGAGFQRYWKLWSENFTKLLMLFPIMMGIIYAGRIVAWIGGGVGGAGFLDFCLVVVAYFGPLFYLPKAFGLGGSWMSAANRAINESMPVKKGREVGNRELRGLIGRRSGQSSNYNPFEPALTGYGKFKMPTSKWVPKSLRGEQMAVVPRGGRAITRIKSGSIIPTARGRALTQKKYADWKSERKAEQAAYVDRKYEVGDKEGFRGRFWSWDGENWKPDDNIDPVTGQPKKGVGSGKRAVMRSMLHGNDRERTAAMEKFFNTSSSIEGQSSAAALKPEAWDDGSIDSKEIQDYVGGELRQYIDREYGLDNLELDVNGNPIIRMHMLPEFEKVQENDPQLWGKLGRGDWLPPVLQTKYKDDLMDKYNIGVTRDANGTIIARDEALRSKLRGKRLRDRDRVAYAIDESYVQPSNIERQPQGFHQEVARTNDKMLMAKYANLLAAVANGGQAGAGKLVNMTGGEDTSLVNDINKALEPLGITYQDYIQAAKTNATPLTFKIEGNEITRSDGYVVRDQAGEEPVREQGGDRKTSGEGGSSSGGATDTSTSSNNSGSTSPRNVPSGNEQIIFQQQPRVVQTQPGEIVSTGGVVLSPRAQEQMNRQFSELHEEFKKLRRLEGTRNEQEERRFREIKSQNPQFENEPDEEEEGSQS